MSANKPKPAGPSNAAIRWMRVLARQQNRGLVLTAVVLIAAIAAALYGWQRFGGLVAQSPDDVLTPERISVTPPPPWIHADVKAEVVRSANLARLNLRDPRLVEQLAAAFALHPWVAKVVRVQKRFPAAADVELKYRRPVAVVRVEPQGESRLVFIDETATFLPSEDFAPEQGKNFLRIEAAGEVPTSGYGLPWKSERIAGAARVAAALTQRWQPLGLYRIVAVQSPDGHLLYELRTPRDVRIVWGAVPGHEMPAEPTAEQKIHALEQFVRDKGPLDRDGGATVLDLRTLAKDSARQSKAGQSSAASR
jgi:hypothetical protein